MPLVTTTVNLLSQDPAVREVDIVVEGTAPPLPADAEMLRVVFHNLLINGAHAMHGKGQIRVAVEAGDSMCQIAFTDAGPGIPTELRDKIFTPFFNDEIAGLRAGTADRQASGRGAQGTAGHQLSAGGRHDHRRTPAHRRGVTAPAPRSPRDVPCFRSLHGNLRPDPVA